MDPISRLMDITSSKDVVEFEDKVRLKPIAAAARATSISPSPPANLCIALGAIPMGRGYVWPSNSADVSTSATSRRTRGRTNSLFGLINIRVDSRGGFKNTDQSQFDFFLPRSGHLPRRSNSYKHFLEVCF